MLYLAEPSDRMGLLIGLILHITSGKGQEVYGHMDLRIFQNMGYDGWIGSKVLNLIGWEIHICRWFITFLNMESVLCILEYRIIRGFISFLIDE